MDENTTFNKIVSNCLHIRKNETRFRKNRQRKKVLES